MGGQGGDQARTMSDDVHQLRDASSSPVDLVVSALEDALEEARSGRLRNVVIVGDLAGTLYYRNCGMDDRIRLLGFLEAAKQVTVKD